MQYNKFFLIKVRKMIKKILKWSGIAIGSLVALIVIAGVAVMLIVDKKMIEKAMEDSLNRQVRIGEVNIGLFSAISGIEVKDVNISNYKSKKALEKLEGKPVARNDIFAGLGGFNFKFSVVPILSGNIVLNELILHEPKINIVRYSNGLFNFSDLLVSKKLTEEEKAELARKESEKAETPPLKADDIPVAVSVGQIGIEKGSVNIYDQKTKQRISIYNLTAKLFDIEIDPGDLKNRDNIKLLVRAGIKTVGKSNSKSFKSFDISLNTDGNIIPFDRKTRILNPEIVLKAGSPNGTMNGLQLFESMKSVEALDKYSGKFNFLKKEMKWKDSFVTIWYKNGIVKLTDGKIKTSDYLMTLKGTINTNNDKVNIDSDMLLNKKHTASVKGQIKKKAGKLITGRVKDYLTSDEVADAAMSDLTNKDNQIELAYKVKGTLSKPKTKVVKPKLGSLKSIVSKAAKKASGKAVSKAKDKAKKVVRKKAGKEAKKAADKAKKKLKKLF